MWVHQSHSLYPIHSARFPWAFRDNTPSSNPWLRVARDTERNHCATVDCNVPVVDKISFAAFRRLLSLDPPRVASCFLLLLERPPWWYYQYFQKSTFCSCRCLQCSTLGLKGTREKPIGLLAYATEVSVVISFFVFRLSSRWQDGVVVQVASSIQLLVSRRRWRRISWFTQNVVGGGWWQSVADFSGYDVEVSTWRIGVGYLTLKHNLIQVRITCTSESCSIPTPPPPPPCLKGVPCLLGCPSFSSRIVEPSVVELGHHRIYIIM